MVEQVVRHKAQTYYPTIKRGSKSEEVLKKYVNSFIVIGGVVVAKERTSKAGRPVDLVDIKKPEIIAHFDPTLRHMMVPISEKLAEDVATFQIKRTKELEIGETVTLHCLVIQCTNEKYTGHLCLAHDSATLSAMQTIGSLVKCFLVDAELAEWRGEALKEAMNNFERSVYICSTMPFVLTWNGKERMKMAATITKGSVVLMLKRMTQIGQLLKDAKADDGNVNIPKFTKAIFTLQDLFVNNDGVEFYEKIRNQDPSRLKLFKKVEPLFEIDKSNALLVLEATKEVMSIAQQQAEDGLEPGYEEDPESELQLI